MLTILSTTAVLAQNGFRDLGVGAPVSESRGFVALQTPAGKNLAIALATDQSTRGYLLVVDLDSGEVEQAFYPEGVVNSDPFASMLSKNGRFYTGAGPTLLEYDPVTRKYLYHGVPNLNAACFVGEAFADGPEGLIYIGTYPDCHLLTFDPKTKAVKDLGQIDPEEKYFNYLMFDSAGWAYAGIGTARCNLVAFNPQTGERRQLLPESERKTGTGWVCPAADGKVFGMANGQYYRLFEGKAEKVDKSETTARGKTGAFGWGVRDAVLADGRKVRLNLPEANLEVTDPKTNVVKKLPLKFESGGAMLTSLAVGPDHCVYASSAHPMHLVKWDPVADRRLDLGPVNRVGGGNFCAMATQGRYLAAASYSLGIMHLYDTTLPFNGGYGDQPNPRELAEWHRDLCRPRACIAHPDGRSIIMGGFAGYGLVGGGLGIYDLQEEKGTLLTHEQVIPNESTIALRVLPGGDLIGGTSIEAPGGGHTSAKEATLYLLDWKSKQVVFKSHPLPGASDIISLELGPDGLVYGLGSGSKLFVFDPQTRQVTAQVDLSAYGAPLRQSLLVAEGKLYAVLSNGLVSLQPGTGQATLVATPPQGIAAGAVCHAGKLYFACRSHLWSYDLK